MNTAMFRLPGAPMFMPMGMGMDMGMNMGVGMGYL